MPWLRSDLALGGGSRGRRGRRGRRRVGGAGLSRVGRGRRRRSSRRRRGVHVRGDRQRSGDLREPSGAFLHRQRLEVEEPAVRSELAVTDANEVAQTEEEVGEVEVVPLEGEVDRERAVAGPDRSALRRDGDEFDSGCGRDVVELEDDPRHVVVVGHRLRDLEEVRDLDRARVALLRLPLSGARDLDLRVQRCDLVRDLRGLGLLRLDQQEIADGGEDQERRDDDDCDRDLLLLHCWISPSGAIVAAMTNWYPPSSAFRALGSRRTSANSGTTDIRESSRATAACVAAVPSILNVVSPAGAPLRGSADPDVPLLAVMLKSTTGSGRTSENSRRIRSQATRVPSASASAAVRAWLSPASDADGSAASGPICAVSCASSARRSSASARLSATLALDVM